MQYRAAGQPLDLQERPRSPLRHTIEPVRSSAPAARVLLNHNIERMKKEWTEAGRSGTRQGERYRLSTLYLLAESIRIDWAESAIPRLMVTFASGAGAWHIDSDPQIRAPAAQWEAPDPAVSPMLRLNSLMLTLFPSTPVTRRGLGTWDWSFASEPLEIDGLRCLCTLSGHALTVEEALRWSYTLADLTPYEQGRQDLLALMREEDK